jgi:hypothetical protein
VRIPAGEGGLPVSDDTGKYSSVSWMLRQFPRLRYLYAHDVVQATVARHLLPKAQRSGPTLLLVYDAAELKELLAAMEASPPKPTTPYRAARPVAGWPDARVALRDSTVVPRELADLLSQIYPLRGQLIQAVIDVRRKAGLTWGEISGWIQADDRAALDAASMARGTAAVKDPDEVLELSEQSLLEAHEAFRRIARHPGYMHDVRGQLLLGPGGSPQVDQDVRIKALGGQVKTVETWDRLRGVVAPARTQVSVDMGPLEERLLAGYAALEANAVASAQQRLALEGDVVEGEVLRDEETQHEGKKPRRKKPRRVSADDASADERGQEQQEG